VNIIIVGVWEGSYNQRGVVEVDAIIIIIIIIIIICILKNKMEGHGFDSCDLR
jgi:hypothetical protein